MGGDRWIGEGEDVVREGEDVVREGEDVVREGEMGLVGDGRKQPAVKTGNELASRV